MVALAADENTHPPPDVPAWFRRKQIVTRRTGDVDDVKIAPPHSRAELNAKTVVSIDRLPRRQLSAPPFGEPSEEHSKNEHALMRRFVSRQMFCLLKERSNRADGEWAGARDAERRENSGSIQRTIDFG
jgi:hypothetical protein